ncbi:4Fe-4S binding protein [Hymenobacter gummosus]|uniref:4Fe-4S binding protein n=1 Tax=Hymenobacter gummosus TaxID=1776032 RepID=A0A431U825_9BACT|nr:4Fe-4S dicluster domain-containing protein [Hymenobacter gummosus]RTQ52411.1 4Fe-4S binding protein [Hymenobacter gummosus]
MSFLAAYSDQPLAHPTPEPSAAERLWLALVALGLLALGVAALAPAGLRDTAFWLGLGLLSAGALGWSWRKFGGSRGVRHNFLWSRASTSRGAVAWAAGVALTGFYVVLYWWPAYLENLIRPLDGLSQLLRGRAADQWFLYGSFYTLAVLLMGGRALLKYRHSPYQRVRTASVMFFQLGLAWLLPGVLLALQQPEFYFTYFWPLKYDYLFPGGVQSLLQNGHLGAFMVGWGIIMSFVATPVLTYFFGKRWYCSWVCGCGGLAETAGDPYRHLSDKRREAWRYEVSIVYTVLGFIVVTTALLWLNAARGGALLGRFSDEFAQTYGFFIGSIFAGVVGVGFYPILGSRVWCRYGCPMAAYLGLLQKHFSRFRITTNGGQCISCGNCSNVCEMGIDVKQYAQRGEPIIRAACVGCGLCSTACPRGVLNLENGPREGRYQPSQLIHADSLRILS